MVECDRECAKQYFPTVFSVILLLADAISSCSIDEKAEVLNGFIGRVFIGTVPLFYVTDVGHWFSRDRFTFAKYFNDNMSLRADSL